MTEKEINLKSVIFLVIGILLLLSLVICIYIVNGEKDLVSVNAKVVDVKKDENGTGKNDITVSYDIEDTTYNYNFYYKDNIQVNDIIPIYYHQKNINSVTTFKTTKFIFVFPVIGLFLCVISLFELFRQTKDEVLFQTSVIDISGSTQKLEIVTADTVVENYVSLPEEQVEAEVKAIKKEKKIHAKKLSDKTQTVQKEEHQEKEETKEDWYIEVKEEQTLDNEMNQPQEQNQFNININNRENEEKNTSSSQNNQDLTKNSNINKLEEPQQKDSE